MYTVALPGDLPQLADHRVLRGGIAIVQLQRIWPAREIGMAAVCQKPVAVRALDPGIVARLPLQVEFCSGNVVLRMLIDPVVCDSSVSGTRVLI
jgi:hypothetical protein